MSLTAPHLNSPSRLVIETYTNLSADFLFFGPLVGCRAVVLLNLMHSLWLSQGFAGKAERARARSSGDVSVIGL